MPIVVTDRDCLNWIFENALRCEETENGMAIYGADGFNVLPNKQLGDNPLEVIRALIAIETLPKVTSDGFPASLTCNTCGKEMPCVSHEAQPIADQVKRRYICTCGSARTVYIDVFTLEVR